MMNTALQDLEQRLAWERETLSYPDRVWPRARTDESGEPVLDVLLIGAGLAGIAIAIRLLRMGIANFRLYDENPAGREGPWVTYARMVSLRTDKRLHGPDGGFPSATFRAWYEAQFGAEDYARLSLIPKEQWMDYLVWLRKAFALPIVNDTRILSLTPHPHGLRVELDGPQGRRVVVARKVVAATGLAGAGGGRVPFDMSGIDPARWKHSRDVFDFAPLRGKRVAVIGGSASALDNAAAALDAGAAQVDQFIRRRQHPERNVLRYLEFAGMFRSFILMPDDLRLEIARTSMENAVPPPLWSIERCQAYENFALRMGLGWRSLRQEGDEIVIALTDGREQRADFIIFGTGFEVDLSKVDYLQELAADILRWRDAAKLGDDAIDQSIGRHPYIGPYFECRGRSPASDKILSNLIIANPAAVVSAGPSAVGINGCPFSSARIVEGIVQSLYLEDAAWFVEGLADFEHSEFTGLSNQGEIAAK
ncbi:NAD(P)-binding domain-containing protein [Brenneria sp. g21c3]|uniref:NAD(P)-binding domain-containing protein n=1 Tax=Brenneria sp. g21c3 TaxID=3093893 RepID=UPI002EB8E853|nr:NAD(P)-binding domain-containing protein [Brenneria sp. g21c3]